MTDQHQKTTDLETRRQFWASHHVAEKQGGLPIIVDKFLHLFQNRGVLEIGPGEGRQANVIKPLASHYAIADICPEVVKRYEHGYLVTPHFVESVPSFDVIHCWYVVHHMLDDERLSFFKFAHRNLYAQGRLLFNIPRVDISPVNELAADGIKTTPVTLDQVLDEALSLFNLTLYSRDVRSYILGFVKA